MNQEKINQLTAASTTVTFCETPASVAATASIPQFAPTVALVKGKIVIVQSYNILGDKPIKGVTLNVKGIRESMMQHTYPLASAIVAYAASLTPPDKDLIAQAKFSVSYLEDLSKTQCATECDRIRQLASLHEPNIVPFGVTGTDITDTATLVTLYMTAINDSRAAIVSRSSAKKQADLNLKNIMDNLLALQLDTMANTLRFKNSEWWGQYHQSREIIDLGKTFTKLRATAKDEQGNPIKGAVVSLIQNNEVKYTKNTDAEGKVSIVKIKPGNYNIKVEKENYTSQTEVDAHFAPGAEKNHPFVLQSNTAPPDFNVEEYNIPGNGSLIIPLTIPNPIPVDLEIYLLAKNGNAVLCTTDLPANPCSSGFNLNMGIVYQGPVIGLGLDFTKSNLQLTNLSPNILTLAAGTNNN